MRVKNWASFQHFKDRSPIWIKLYRALLDDKDWHKLDAEASKMLVNLWLLASEDDGELPDFETIAFRFRTTEQHVIECVSRLLGWLEQVDTELLSDGYQIDDLEKRREEKNREEKNHMSADADVCVAAWNDMASRAGLARVQVITKPRVAAINARLKECGGVDGWREMLRLVEASAYLTGANERGWRADLDFVSKQSKFAKIMEGAYDRSSKSPGNRNSGATGFNALALSETGGIQDREPLPG